MQRFLRPNCMWLFAAVVMLMPNVTWSATPSAEQALKLKPIQGGVDYDRPAPEEAAKCKIMAKKFDGRVGWVVLSSNGTMLRKFIDTNNDNVVDQWCYYKDGLEVYRDIDSTFNGKADQYRWFNTAGTRWAIDANEDGVIDRWKSISAEEVSAEVIAALATHDAERFGRLLLTPTELKSLGLGKSRAESAAEKLSKAANEFKAMSARQKIVTNETTWEQFIAGRPGLVPAGTDDSTNDLRVYENVTAIVENAGKSNQVLLGTLVQVGDTWRVLDLPQTSDGGQTAGAPSGFFFQAAMHRTDGGDNGGASSPAANDAGSKLLGDLESLDRESAQASTPEQRAQVANRRAELLEKMADAAKTPEDRAMWLRQLADMISAAVQSGESADGAERLKALFEKLEKSDADKALASYVKFRQLTADYVLAMQAKKADYSKIQAEWLKTLEKYINDYPTAADTAEAMLQLAISQEFVGQEDDAKKWYGRIVKEFPDSGAAKKAAGAQTRLDCVGKTIVLNGPSPAGSPVDLANYRGKVVLIQYWASWSSPAKADMATLKELWNKYGQSFTVLGVNLDNNVKDLNAYLSENPLPWPQIYEPGGLDGRPANVLGILTVPTMILVDPQGKVVDRNIAIADVEAAIKRLTK